MKAGELKKIAKAHKHFFPAPWVTVGNEFMRIEGDWVQIISFNASRFADIFVPRSSMDFLKMPGVPTAPILVQELRGPKGTQRWLKPIEPLESVFQEMSAQFRPSLQSPLNSLDVRNELGKGLEYWPNAYALTVIACEEGDAAKAQHYFGAFLCATADKPYPWAMNRKDELAECLGLLESSESLRAHLDAIRRQKLETLKLSPADGIGS